MSQTSCHSVVHLLQGSVRALTSPRMAWALRQLRCCTGAVLACPDSPAAALAAGRAALELLVLV